MGKAGTDSLAAPCPRAARIAVQVVMLILLAPAVAPGAAAGLAHLAASDAVDRDAFGNSVAISGDWLLVGAPERGDSGDDSGAAYVFRRNGVTWTETTKLTASDAAAGDRFGGSVALGPDTLAVAARDDDDAGEGSGSVYVFPWNGTVWGEPAKLVASGAHEGDSFGCSVSLSGQTLAVGAYATDADGESSGSVYIFQHEAGLWRQRAELTASDARQAQYFGCSVAVDGDRLVVGARGDDDRGVNAGAVYLFARRDGQWAETGKYVPSDVAEGDYFGRTVAIDGDTVVASAPGDDPAGAAYAFRWDGVACIEESKLTVPGAGEGDGFGCGVAIDGEDLVVGARGDDEAGGEAGAGYVFRREGGAWEQVSKLTASDDAGGRLGGSVALREGCVVAGAPGSEEQPLVPGSVHVFSTGTRTAWRGPGSSGSWSDANHWTAGVPDANMDVSIDGPTVSRVDGEGASARTVSVGAAGPGTLRIEGATLSLRALCVGGQGGILADANGTLRVQGDLENHATDPGRFDLSGATVAFGGAASGGPARLEVAGADLGLDPAGWEGNFAIGSLVVEPGAALQLVNEVQNDPNGGAEALYVGELTIGPQGRIDLCGAHLYYRNGGVAKKLLRGDSNLDGLVDRLDYLVLQESFGTRSSAGWADGDSDADGDVDALDYLAIKQGFDLACGGSQGEAPEPSVLCLLVLGAGVLLRPGRRGALQWTRRAPEA